MKIVINKQELEEHVVNLLKTIPGNKLLLDHYLDGAIEAKPMRFAMVKMCIS
jgi:carbamoyl-phosphate synthase large subunit